MRGRFLALVLLAVLSQAFAQQETSRGRGSPGHTTLTRSASKYRALEMNLVQALLDRRDAEVDQIVARDFEVWSAEQSGPTSRGKALRWSAGPSRQYYHSPARYAHPPGG